MLKSQTRYFTKLLLVWRISSLLFIYIYCTLVFNTNKIWMLPFLLSLGGVVTVGRGQVSLDHVGTFV